MPAGLTIDILVVLIAVVLVLLVGALVLRSGGARGEKSHVSQGELETRNREKGKAAELAVQRLLETSLPPNEYLILGNLFIPRGTTGVEIDNVIVSRFGVFAVEVKSWAGRLIDNGTGRKWTQQLGRSEHPKRNPIDQSLSQQRALAEFLNLGRRYIHGVVCMADANMTLEGAKAPNVVFMDELVSHVQGHRHQVLSDEGVSQLVTQLSTHREKPRDWPGSD